MQTLNADPRDAFTVAQIEALLLSENIEVDTGLELLDLDLTLIEDISQHLADGGSIKYDLNNRIHRTCSLELTTAISWGTQLVRPYLVLSGAGISDVRFNLGVFMLTTPVREIGRVPTTYAVQGFDRVMLLDREVGADYSVLSGTTYRQALLDAFSAAGLSGVYIEGSAADNTLPATKSWPLVANDESDPDQTDTPATWLRVVNDLLQAINFRGVWCDADGTYQCVAYQDPSSRAPEFVFDADDEHTTIVGDDREQHEDIWQTPNKWVFRWKNGGTGIEGDGIYTVDLNNVDASNPLAQINRGLYWTKVVDYDAASQAKLEELGDRYVDADLRHTSVMKVGTGTFPPAGHADVYTYADTRVGIAQKVQAVQWELSLDGSMMTWEWEKIS